jgi:hypothetical protein
VAKAKPTNSIKQQSTISVKRKSPAAAEGRSATPARTSAAVGTQPAISSSEIGRVAGDVWGLLSRDGGLTIAAIKKSVDAPADVVVAAIGWLAREDKLEFSTSGRAVKISLR